jgi:hypothetical protein
MKEAFNRELAKWNKRLAAEGMPDELQPENSVEEHSQAFEAGIRDLGLYLIENDRQEHYAHREQVGEIQSRMKAAGATEDEIESLSEDFVRDVADTIDRIQLAAQLQVQELLSKRPQLADHPNTIARDVLAHLAKDSSPMISKDVLLIAAQRAVDTIVGRSRR